MAQTNRPTDGESTEIEQLSPLSLAIRAFEQGEQVQYDVVIDPEMPVWNALSSEFAGLPRNWPNWIPRNAVNKLLERQDPALALAALVRHALSRWAESCRSEGLVPEKTPIENIFGAYHAVSRRFAKGAMGELAVREFGLRSGRFSEVWPVPEDQTAQQRLENSGIDLIVDDGHSIQVKTGTKDNTDDWSDEIKDADELVWVEVDSDHKIIEIHWDFI
jgi:hypothetical protein